MLLYGKFCEKAVFMKNAGQFRDYFESSPEHGKNTLPAIPHGCGYENNLQHVKYDVTGYRKGNLPRVLLQYTLSGGGLLEIENNSLYVAPGKAMLLEMPGIFHYKIAPGEKHWESFFVSFRDPFSIRFIHTLIARYGNLVTISDDTQKQALRIYELLKRKEATCLYEISRAGYNFLMSLAVDLESGGTDGRRNLQNRVDAYCMKNLDRKVTVEELARHCGYTRSHFCRIFHKITGKRPSEFILHFKLEMAKRILLNEDVSVKETAMRCGFGDYSYFCRAFKRRYGMTAARFAASGKEDDSEEAAP